MRRKGQGRKNAGRLASAGAQRNINPASAVALAGIFGVESDVAAAQRDRQCAWPWRVPPGGNCRHFVLTTSLDDAGIKKRYAKRTMSGTPVPIRRIDETEITLTNTIS
jgi:hypothetical protein